MTLARVIGDQFMLNLPGLVEERIPGYAVVRTSARRAHRRELRLRRRRSCRASPAALPSPACRRSWDRPSGSGLSAVRPARSMPQCRRWSFGIRQALEARVLSLGYAGRNHGVFVPVYNEGLNAFERRLCAVSRTPHQPRSSAPYNNIPARHIELQRPHRLVEPACVTYGFSVQASYTWAHANDEVSNTGVLSTPYNNTNATFSATPSNVQYQINPACLRCYGLRRRGL